MLIWFLLFVAILLVSFVLAYNSMADYYERPENLKTPYGLYLVRQPESLTEDIIKRWHQDAYQNRLILSFEKLFRGSRQALVVFGPTSILQPFFDSLRLLELEDYSQKIDTDKIKQEQNGVAAWAVGTKNPPEAPVVIQNLLSYIPKLEEHQEFWWQIVVQPKGKGEGGGQGMEAEKRQGPNFQGVIRAVAKAENKEVLKPLQEQLSKIGKEVGLAPLPQAYSTSQLIKFYQERSLPQFMEKGQSFILTSGEIQSLTGLS